MKLRFVTRGPHCQGLTPDAYSRLPKPERDHFVLCQKCDHYFDMRRLDQAVAHSFLDHNACSPIARTYSGSRGEPGTIKHFKAIPRGQTAAIDGADFDRMRKR
jgi:hypothetical protein